MSQKIIVSSKGPSDFISKHSLLTTCNRFEICEDVIEFCCKETVARFSISHSKISNKGDYYGRFYSHQWFQIKTFIDSLSEQPVVLDFVHYSHTNIHEHPEISISQITKTFNA